MSLAQVARFFQASAGDTVTFGELLNEATGGDFPTRLAEAGRRQGYEFTAAEAASWLKSQTPGADGSLSDELLENISGGVGGGGLTQNWLNAIASLMDAATLQAGKSKGGH
jgi:hypothetical protein